MMALNARTACAFALVLLSAGLPACGSGGDSGSDKQTCPEGHVVGGECVGVTSQAICDSDSCTAGVACSKVIDVRSDAELQAAIGSASAGSCIALAPGNYGDATLPAGVSLLGKGAMYVTVAHVALSGDAATLRGVTVMGGVELRSTANAHVDSVRATNGMGDGITFENDASATIVNSDIENTARYGVKAFGSGSVQIDRTFVGHGLGPGLWVECSTGCMCVTKPTVTVTNTALRDNKIIGVSLVAATATFTNVDVTDNTESGFNAAGGMSISQCSTIAAKALNVSHNSYFGVLMDHSGGMLGGSGTNEDVTVDGNLMGVWVQNLSTMGDQPVKLENCHLDANIGVGIGLSGQSNGIIIYGTEVKNTQSTVLPVVVGGVGAGSKEVGDGLNWLDLSGAAIDGLSLSGNARASLLIDGAVASGSTISNVTLGGGDESKGILQQNLPTGGLQPQIGTGVPNITVNMSEVFAVPTAPAVPSGI